jgi:hypothetical protein
MGDGRGIWGVGSGMFREVGIWTIWEVIRPVCFYPSAATITITTTIVQAIVREHHQHRNNLHSVSITLSSMRVCDRDSCARPIYFYLNAADHHRRQSGRSSDRTINPETTRTAYKIPCRLRESAMGIARLPTLSCAIYQSRVRRVRIGCLRGVRWAGTQG